MTWAGLAKLILGFLIAIALIGSGGYLAAQYVIAEFTKPPAKPMFPNDKPKVAAKPKVAPVAAAVPQPSPSATPSPQPTPAAVLMQVTLSEGLNLRAKPSQDSERVGGLDYQDRVVVLEESSDKEWQRVRLEGSNDEGWIRAGYTERVN